MVDSKVSGLHGCEESLSDSRDRLSELPDSLILEILSLLPMRDVVKTTLLSKRWEDLWTTVPCLDFSNIPTDNDSYKFRRFLCGARALWKGVKILKFSLSFWLDYNTFGRNNIYDSWLLFSVEKQVEDLSIDFIKCLSWNFRAVDYYVPQFLYSCSSIKKLSIVSFKLKIDKNVQWNQLKSLTIGGGAEPLSDVSLNHILSGAPHLEVLNLSFLAVKTENLIINIRSTSLKMVKLKIQINSQYILGFLAYAADNTMLRIWAPNLQSLEISGVTYRMCVLDVPSLTTAILDFRDVYMRSHETLRQIFASIHHVRKLTLTYPCIYDQSPTVLVAEPWSEISLNHILSGVPNLEVLNLTIRESGENDLNIRSTSLKMLKINWSSYTTANKTMLRIRAPNLETLEISEFPNRKCLLNVPSLTNAILVFGYVDIALQEMLGRRIFESILNHVEKVTLSDTCTEVLLKMKKKYMEKPSNAKFLKLIYARAPNKILGVLKMFPRLTMLVIECNKRMPLLASEESDALDIYSKKSCRLLQYLKTVEITWPLHDPSIYLVIEILLKNAQMLEKMVFRPLTVSSPQSMSLAEEKVRSMPRSSPTAELIFINKY